MPISVNSYAADSATSDLKLHQLERRDLMSDDVLIKILYCGVCHSDLHTCHADWGKPNYPVTPGHEIVGQVEQIGSDVNEFRVGEIVAVGCMVDSCGDCEMCEGSNEMFCFNGTVFTYDSPEIRVPGKFSAGGYSEKIVVQKKFVLHIPEELQSKELLPGVASILCAGISMYSPLNQYNVKKGCRVAVAGLGGLGHMGVKLAVALGAEVTLISRSHKKDAQAKALGVTNVLATQEELNSANGKFDLILDTIPFDHDINGYFPLLAPFGTLCIVGHLGTFSKSINSMSLIFGNKRLSGTVIGGIKETQELLNFCAEHKIVSDHKLIPFDKVNDAWNSLSRGDVADRFVLDIGNYRV